MPNKSIPKKRAAALRKPLVRKQEFVDKPRRVSAAQVREAMQQLYPRGMVKKGMPYRIVDNEREEQAALLDGYQRLMYMTEEERRDMFQPPAPRAEPKPSKLARIWNWLGQGE